MKKINLTTSCFLISALFIISGIFYSKISTQRQDLIIQQKEKSDNLSFFSQLMTAPSDKSEISLIAVGDISFSRGIERIVKKEGDINYPFLKIKDYLQSADFTFGNLETPITAGEEIPTGQMIFRSNPGTETALRKAGFSILSLANNHTPNFGQKGLEDTCAYLEKADIKYVGAGQNSERANQAIYTTAKNINLAFLAYNDAAVVPVSYEANDNQAGTAFMRIEKMTTAVKEAKKRADFVIVSMHSGTEYIPRPNDSQINFAHAAVDAGADLVLGGHPHVVQTVEKYRDKYIFYSLGNFVFDQSWSSETQKGLALKIYFTKKEITKIALAPYIMKNFAQPTIVYDNEADNILKRLRFPLTNNIVYSWNNDTNSFEKNFRPVIRPEHPVNIFDNDFNLAKLNLVRASVNLSGPICEFKIADINNDQKNELVAVEGDCFNRLVCSKNNLAIYQWAGTNFINLYRSKKGNFSNLLIEKMGNENEIVIDEN